MSLSCAMRAARLARAQELLHPPSPGLPFDVHQRLQLPQVMGVAQAVLHPLHREVRLPVIVHDDAADTREQGAASATDPVSRQQRRADHMKPLRLPADPEPGLVHVFTRAVPAQVCMCEAASPQPLCRPLAHRRQCRSRHRRAEQLGHHLRQPILRQEVGVLKVDRNPSNARGRTAPAPSPRRGTPLASPSRNARSTWHALGARSPPADAAREDRRPGG